MLRCATNTLADEEGGECSAWQESAEESRQKLHQILGAPYERVPWRHDGDESDKLEVRLDMELIWSLLRTVVGHAREMVEEGTLSAEEDLFIKVMEAYQRYVLQVA